MIRCYLINKYNIDLLMGGNVCDLFDIAHLGLFVVKIDEKRLKLKKYITRAINS